MTSSGKSIVNYIVMLVLLLQILCYLIGYGNMEVCQELSAFSQAIFHTAAFP
jgi:hypothetical protein